MSSRFLIVFCCLAISYGLFLAGCTAPMPKVKAPVELEKAEPMHFPTAEQPSREAEKVVPYQTPGIEDGMQQEAELQEIWQKPVSPESEKIGQRLTMYQESLWNWNVLEEQMSIIGVSDERPSGWYVCLTQLERLVSNYSQMRETGIEGIQAEDIEAGYWLDIDFLESNCDEIYKIAEAAASDWTGHFADSQAEQFAENVKYLAENGMDKEAVQAYRNLTSSFPDHSISPAVSKAYILALIRTEQFTTAITTLQQSMNDLEAQQDVLFLQRMLADLLLAAGKVEEAKVQYSGLVDTFSELKDDDLWVADQLAVLGNIEGYDTDLMAFIEIMRAYISFDGKHVPGALRRRAEQIEIENPASIFANRARNILWQVEEQAGSWVGRKLVKVDNLTENKEYRKAVAILDDLLKEQLSPEIRDVVQKTLDEVLVAEIEDQKAKQLLIEQARTMQWNEATRLFEMRRYDDAIAAFTLLLHTEYDEQAREKITDSANLAAAEMRRTAANLFVKARRTTSSDQRKELMLESWQLLNQIPLKYPDAEILDKVAENIKILESQIRILEPDLLDEIYGADAVIE